MLVIFESENSILATMRGAPEWMAAQRDATTGAALSEEAALIRLADKDLPAGTRYEIVEESALPDKRFRGAWRYVSGPEERIAGAGHA